MFKHKLRVRYGDIDQQGVVYNPHYLTYVDEALEHWILPISRLRQELGWDMMLKKAELEWQGSLGYPDELTVSAQPVHFGNSSWSVRYTGKSSGREVFTADVLYISIKAGENRPMPTPEPIRDYLLGRRRENGEGS